MSRGHDADSENLETASETVNGKERKKMSTVAAFEHERIEAQSTISSRGQIVVPAKILRRLGLKEGDLIRFVYEDGSLMVEPISLLSAEQLFGALDREEDKGNFVLDMEAARTERAQTIMSRKNIGGDHVATEDGDLD